MAVTQRFPVERTDAEWRQRLTPEQYARLCDHMSASFKRDDQQRSLVIDHEGYTDTDAFYEANGRYTAFRTCNVWSGQALAAGGVRVGYWTPMKWGILWQLPPVSEL